MTPATPATTDAGALADRFTRRIEGTETYSGLSRFDLKMAEVQQIIAALRKSALQETRGDEAVAWCQPMDCGKHTPRKFMLYFDDPDHGIMVFDSEADAREAFERKNTAWNCYLFGSLPLAPPQQETPSSPAPFLASHNSGERDPSVMPDCGAGDPVAWVGFAENGNIRLWGKDRAGAEARAAARGLKCEPVYRAAPQQSPRLERERIAATVHKARWPADRQMTATPFADEDRNGREYCFRIADAILALLSPDTTAVSSTWHRRSQVIGKVTGTEYEGDQVPGMPGAICRACGLKDYPCQNPDCPNATVVSSKTQGPI
jgi:hypothetical protein